MAFRIIANAQPNRFPKFIITCAISEDAHPASFGMSDYVDRDLIVLPVDGSYENTMKHFTVLNGTRRTVAADRHSLANAVGARLADASSTFIRIGVYLKYARATPR
jgi:hypothetical protein